MCGKARPCFCCCPSDKPHADHQGIRRRIPLVLSSLYWNAPTTPAARGDINDLIETRWGVGPPTAWRCPTSGGRASRRRLSRAPHGGPTHHFACFYDVPLTIKRRHPDRERGGDWTQHLESPFARSVLSYNPSHPHEQLVGIHHP
jgi:hypothetical protein